MSVLEKEDILKACLLIVESVGIKGRVMLQEVSQQKYATASLRAPNDDNVRWWRDCH